MSPPLLELRASLPPRSRVVKKDSLLSLQSRQRRTAADVVKDLYSAFVMDGASVDPLISTRSHDDQISAAIEGSSQVTSPLVRKERNSSGLTGIEKGRVWKCRRGRRFQTMVCSTRSRVGSPGCVFRWSIGGLHLLELHSISISCWRRAQGE